MRVSNLLKVNTREAGSTTKVDIMSKGTAEVTEYKNYFGPFRINRYKLNR